MSKTEYPTDVYWTRQLQQKRRRYSDAVSCHTILLPVKLAVRPSVCLNFLGSWRVDFPQTALAHYQRNTARLHTATIAIFKFPFLTNPHRPLLQQFLAPPPYVYTVPPSPSLISSPLPPSYPNYIQSSQCFFSISRPIFLRNDRCCLNRRIRCFYFRF